MTRRFPRLFAAIVLLTTPAAVLAQKDMGPAAQYYGQQGHTKFKFSPGPKKTGGDITWETAQGGRQEIEKDEYAILEKDVVVKYQDITIRADKATVNLKTKDVVAQGHVIIDQGPSRLTADQAVFNIDSKLGTLFHATGTMEPSLYFTGDKLEKIDVDRYILTNGIFTSCDLDRPSWSFHVKRADITLNDYAHLQDLSFRAHALPIFWAPRLIWPTKKDRSQGFLIPRIAFTTDFGERIETGYFVPIGDSADVTGYADLNTKGYNGFGAELRYLPTPNVKLGDISAYTVHNVAAGRQEYHYQVKHAEDNLPGGFRGVVDVEDLSNIDFFRDYDRDPRIHTLSQIYSSAYLTKNRPTYSFNFLTDRRDIFGAVIDPLQPPPRQRFEQLPSLQFRLYPNRIGETPFYVSLESSTSHLETSGLTTGLNANYYRADVFPTLSLQLRTPPWLSIRPQVSFRDTWYSQSVDPTTIGTTSPTILEQSVNRTYAQGQVDVVGPSFSRVFNKPFGGFTKFKHVIEPRIRYLYTTDVKDQSRVIPFDTVDSPFLPIVPHSLEYSLTQRIIGRESGPNASAREVASFELRQSVSLGTPFTSTTGGTLPGTTFLPGQQGKFTPLTGTLHVNPYQTITLDASATYGNVSHQIDQTSLSANLLGTGKNADKYLSFTWFASFAPPGTDPTLSASSSQVRLNAGSSLFREHLRGDVQLNFDAKQGTFLEQRYLIGANAACYGVALEFRRYLVYTPLPTPKNSFGISITLKNVGTIGTH